MNCRSEVLLRHWPIESVILLYICGCTGGYLVDTFTNDDGAQISNTVGNEIDVVGGAKEYQGYYKGSSTVFLEKCFLDVGSSKDVDGNVTYFLLLKYVGLDFLNINTGLSLKLVIDDKPKTLSGKGPVKKQKEGKYHTESLDYVIPYKTLIKLANAEEVKVIVSSEHGDLIAYFNKKNFTIFKRFVNEFAKQGN